MKHSKKLLKFLESTFGEDYLPQHVQAECERVIPHVNEVKPADAADISFS